MIKFKKQIGVIGLGIFGQNMVRSLASEKCELVAIEKEEQKANTVSEYISKVVQADASDEKILRQLDFHNFDVAVVTIGENLEASILITMILKNIGVKKVIAKANSSLHADVLMKVGADKIVFPERDEAEKLAKSLVSSNILDMINFADDYRMAEIVVSKKFTGKTLIDADIRHKFGLSVVAIRRKIPILNEDGETDFKEDLNINPMADDVLEEGDSLLIIGERNNIEKFKKL
ncbi:MAG: TrkA family potassium uptake protein [bacterium]|nr:TrkA family potassium uptake protein [bacterium]